MNGSTQSNKLLHILREVINNNNSPNKSNRSSTIPCWKANNKLCIFKLAWFIQFTLPGKEKTCSGSSWENELSSTDWNIFPLYLYFKERLKTPFQF